MIAEMGQQQLKGRVTITDRSNGRNEVWTVDISTVDFPNLPGGRSLPAETCLFWMDPYGIQRGTSVVERYDDWNTAIEGHNRWVNSPRAVCEAMVEAGWRGRG